MASTRDFVTYVLDLMSSWGGVSARRMFSGYGVYRQGVMFALITGDTLYFKTDERSRADFVAAGSGPFAFTKKKRAERVETSYWQAPPDLFDDADEMIRWARRALDAALARRSPQRQSKGLQSKRPASVPRRRAGRDRKMTKN